MYLAKTKYSLENNIEPLQLLEKAKQSDIDKLMIIDDGPYSWLEFNKANKDINLDIYFSICKERNEITLIWIPNGDILKKIAILENCYESNDFSKLKKDDFSILLVPSPTISKTVIQKEIDTLKWLKSNFSKFYMLDKKNCEQKTRILKEKTGVHPIKINEINYLDPMERDVSLMRKSIKTGRLIEDDYRSFLFPKSFLENEMGKFEFSRTERFFSSIKQDFVIKGHPNFKRKKMEYWNTEEIKKTTIPKDWERFFGKKIKLPQSTWEQKKLALLCYKAGKGFNARYKKNIKNREVALNRLKYELSVIADKGFYTYFLIVEDIIRHCLENNIRVGKGRGSVVGSILAYCLNIIQIEPIEYQLEFERFLNPFRSNEPDIDLDFAPSQIERVFDYINEKYGKENVSKILTFNTFGVINAIQAIKNVFKIKERIETWFPQGLNNLDEFLATPEGNAIKNKLISKGYEHILKYVNGIAVLPQALSIHPAGSIISQQLNELPIINKDGERVISFTKQDDQMERLGVTKFDLLRVKTLDVLKQTEEIRKQLDKPILPLDLNDEKTFELYRTGKTIGVFQMKSYGMRKTCQNVKPNNIEELMDIISLHRPGPMEEIPRYVSNKNKGNWTFEKLDQNSIEFKDILPILGKTWGVIIYQEQVIQIASLWAGYSLGEADLLRRAISEKNKELMDSEKKIFITRSLQNGRERSITEYIYFLIERFSDFGFNRNHAGGYALFSFETAFAKAHYPVEFLASSLNVSIDNRKKLKLFLNEAESMGIELLKPDIFESDVYFKVTKDGKIRMGLAAISGIGVKQATKIKNSILPGKIKNFNDIRKQLTEMTGRTMDILIKAGTFDSFGERYEIWQSVKDKKNQKPLDGKSPLPIYSEWENELLQYNFSHFSQFAGNLEPNEFVIESLSVIKDKKGREMAFIKVFNSNGRKELVVYYNVWTRIKEQISIGTVFIPVIKDKNVIINLQEKTNY